MKKTKMKKMKKAFGGQGCEIGNAFVENEKKSKLKKNNFNLFLQPRCRGVEFTVRVLKDRPKDGNARNVK
jgi:hypothetical protein